MRDAALREPIATTLIRTVAISILAGGVWAFAIARPSRWPFTALLMLWPTLGGHFVEVAFLRWLRHRLPSRAAQAAVRLAVWFGGGVALAACVRWSADALGGFRAMDWLSWWRGGLVFVAIELIVHGSLHLRDRLAPT